MDALEEMLRTSKLNLNYAYHEKHVLLSRIDELQDQIKEVEYILNLIEKDNNILVKIETSDR
jgi:hypothetical protein